MADAAPAAPVPIVLEYGLSFDPDKKSFGLWSRPQGSGADWKKEQDISADNIGTIAKAGMAAKKEVVMLLPVTT
jgi:hypothetical protein